MLSLYLTVGTVLFLVGIYVCITKTNAISILMGVELILNASALNFVAFSHFRNNHIEGHVMTIFIIVLAAAEVVVALALLLTIRQQLNSIDTTKVDSLRG